MQINSHRVEMMGVNLGMIKLIFEGVATVVHHQRFINI